MLRWEILLRSQKININKGFLFYSYYIGFFYSNIFPTNIGGDIYRAYDLHNNKHISLNKNLSVIIMERLVSVASASIYVLASFFILYKYLNLKIILSLIVIPLLMIILLLIILKPKKFKLDKIFTKYKKISTFQVKFEQFRNSFMEFKNKTKYIIFSLIYCLISQFLFIACYFFAGLYSKLNLNFLTFLFINPIITLSANIPITIGGIGVRENMAVIVLKRFGANESNAVIFAIVILSIILINAIIGGILYIIKNIFYKSKGFL